MQKLDSSLEEENLTCRWWQHKRESRAAVRRGKSQDNPTYASGLYYTEEGDRIQVNLQFLLLDSLLSQESEVVDHNQDYGQVEDIFIFLHF